MKLILHAGTHKTGTTSIQKVLADNRRWLWWRGLHYPTGRHAFGKITVPHHRFAHGVTATNATDLRKSEIFARKDCRSLWPGKTTIISSEPVYRHIDGQRDYGYTLPDYWDRRHRYLDRLASMLRDFDVRVILFFRERESAAKSLYYEATVRRKYWSGSFDDFMVAFAPWFEYDRQIEAFRASFDDVRTYSYDEAVNGPGLIPFFFNAIGFPMPPGSGDVRERVT